MSDTPHGRVEPSHDDSGDPTFADPEPTEPDELSGASTYEVDSGGS